MKKERELLEQFHAAILSNSPARMAAAIKPHPRLSPLQQMSVYSDGYRIRLTQALRTDYPALASLLGDQSFASLALAYVESHPSASYNLDRYPHGFADFVVSQAVDIFAMEVARLESAIAVVFMMPESNPLMVSDIQSLTVEAFGNLRLALRKASMLLAFEYPVSQWLELQRKGESLAVPEKEASHLYLYRHHNSVQRIMLEPAAYLLLKEISQGGSISEALDRMLLSYPEHTDTIASQFQAWFAHWVAEGFFAA